MEAVPIMMRWNKVERGAEGVRDDRLDRVGVGDGDATIRPDCRATVGAMAPVMRICISVNDSPPSKREEPLRDAAG